MLPKCFQNSWQVNQKFFRNLSKDIPIFFQILPSTVRSLNSAKTFKNHLKIISEFLLVLKFFSKSPLNFPITFRKSLQSFSAFSFNFFKITRFFFTVYQKLFWHFSEFPPKFLNSLFRQHFFKNFCIISWKFYIIYYYYFFFINIFHNFVTFISAIKFLSGLQFL